MFAKRYGSFSPKKDNKKVPMTTKLDGEGGVKRFAFAASPA